MISVLERVLEARDGREDEVEAREVFGRWLVEGGILLELVMMKRNDDVAVMAFCREC